MKSPPHAWIVNSQHEKYHLESSLNEKNISSKFLIFPEKFLLLLVLTAFFLWVCFLIERDSSGYKNKTYFDFHHYSTSIFSVTSLLQNVRLLLWLKYIKNCNQFCFPFLVFLILVQYSFYVILKNLAEQIISLRKKNNERIYYLRGAAYILIFGFVILIETSWRFSIFI